MRFARAKLTPGIYFEDVFIRPKDVIDRIVTAIKAEYPRAGGIVSASGISGASLVVPVAMELKLPFGFVRTKGSHSRMGRVDGHKLLHSPVILDDFISSGRTMRKTIKHLLLDKRKLMPAGIVLYGLLQAEARKDLKQVVLHHDAERPAREVQFPADDVPPGLTNQPGRVTL